MLLVCAMACGKSGPPLPPLRPLPGRIADATANRADDRIELRFTIPAANADGTTPAAIDKVEVYGVAATASAPPPTVAQLLSPANLKTRIVVQRPPPPVDASATPAPTPTPVKETGPLAGDVATYRDELTAADHGANAAVRYYAIVGLAGNRRGTPSNVLAVPLAAEPAAATDLAITYDETTLTLAWTAAADVKYRIYDALAPTAPALSGTAPIAAAVYTTPVVFGKERCFTVRSVSSSGATTIEGPPSAKACATPADTFPPPAPDDLRAIAEETSVALSWNAVTAADLGGYLVLRGDGTGDRLTPLMTTPIVATSYTDTTVVKGATYTYAVVAVDSSPARNRSVPSNRQTVTIRAAAHILFQQ